MRLRSDIWVSALIRRVAAAGAVAMLRRRGAAESGAILVKIDRLDGEATLYGAAPPALDDLPDGIDRLFARQHREATLPVPDVEQAIARQVRFDPDLWVVEIEDRQGRSFLDVAAD